VRVRETAVRRWLLFVSRFYHSPERWLDGHDLKYVRAGLGNRMASAAGAVRIANWRPRRPVECGCPEAAAKNLERWRGKLECVLKDDFLAVYVS